MDWKTVIELVLASSYLMALFGLFYRFGKITENMNLNFHNIDKRFESMDKKIDNLSCEVKDIDRRLCRIEGAMSSKDCCVLKDENKLKKVE